MSYVWAGYGITLAALGGYTAWLLRQVDRTVAPVFAYAAYIGATVVCEYVAYEVDGQILMIDPIRVIKR